MRIVAGEWRGRRIHFPDVAQLRPTPDRLRETLFNWLQSHVGGARCLDLYAGSGALGLEALSRGASAALFVERDARIAAALRATLAAFGDARGRVVERDAAAFLSGPPERFDIVFVDPPYAQGGLGELCTLLESRGWLAADAWIYLELAAHAARPPLPEGWVAWREARAGEALGLLARRRAARAAAAVDGT